MIYVILLMLYGVVESVIWVLWYTKEQKRRKETEKSLYKFLEERVLNLALRHRITSQQAAAIEYQKLFLCVDFLDTKPRILHLFSLDDCITIGRSQSNVICIRDPKLSRVHCKISMIQGRLYLQDSGSANGTVIKRGFFNKIPIASQKMEELYQGDIILVGSYHMRIHTYYGKEARMQ